MLQQQFPQYKDVQVSTSDWAGITLTHHGNRSTTDFHAGGSSDPFYPSIRRLLSRSQQIDIVTAFIQDSGLCILQPIFLMRCEEEPTFVSWAATIFTLPKPKHSRDYSTGRFKVNSITGRAQSISIFTKQTISRFTPNVGILSTETSLLPTSEVQISLYRSLQRD